MNFRYYFHLLSYTSISKFCTSFIAELKKVAAYACRKKKEIAKIVCKVVECHFGGIRFPLHWRSFHALLSWCVPEKSTWCHVKHVAYELNELHNGQTCMRVGVWRRRIRIHKHHHSTVPPLNISRMREHRHHRRKIRG